MLGDFFSKATFAYYGNLTSISFASNPQVLVFRFYTTDTILRAAAVAQW